MSNIYDRLLASAPVNKSAAVAVSSGRSTTPSFRISETELHLHAPLPMIPFVDTQGTGKDFTGAKFGRLTVMGYLGKPKNDKPGKWLVRCVCGSYEVRRTTALKNYQGADLDPKCRSCQHTQKLRDGRQLRPLVSRETSHAKGGGQ